MIVTLRLDAVAQAHFDALRRRFFPPDRLVVGAHVTMFHAIPARCERELSEVLAKLCAGTARFAVTVKGLRFLGRGAAFDLVAPEAQSIRAAIAKHFGADLTKQDSARWSPHITVQNKVAPEVARATMSALIGLSYPGPVTADGVSLWRYRGGPWEHLMDLDFDGPWAPPGPSSPDPIFELEPD